MFLVYRHIYVCLCSLSVLQYSKCSNYFDHFFLFKLFYYKFDGTKTN